MDRQILESATQVEFNGWIFKQLGGNDIDDILTIIERIVKIISIVKKIIETIFAVVIPVGSTLGGDLEGNDSEYLIALTDAIENGYVHAKFYTKAEVDALINQYISAQGGTYSNLFVFSNPQNQISGTLNTNSLTINNKTATDISTAGNNDNNKLATKGYVDYTIVADLATSLANYVSLANNQTITGAKTMTGNNVITASSLTIDNKTATSISTAGSYDNDKLATKGYVDYTIVADLATSLANYVSLANNQTITGAKTMTGNNVITASSLTIDNKTVTSISTGGNSNNDTLTTKGYVDTSLSNFTPDLSNYFTKTEILGLMYPIGSYFLYEQNITLYNNKPTTTTNTILDYFEWQLISGTGVIGIKSSSSSDNAGFIGSYYINVNHLPPHAHKGFVLTGGWNDWGEGFPYNANGWGDSAWKRENVFMRETVGTMDANDNYTENPSQSNFIPGGYYLYCYKRIA